MISSVNTNIFFQPAYNIGYVGLRDAGGAILRNGAVLYPSGLYFVVEYEGKVLNILEPHDDLSEILDIEISTDKTLLLVAGRRQDNSITMSVYDAENFTPKAEVSFPTTLGYSQRYVDSSLTSDNCRALVQLGAPDNVTIIWAWQEGRILASKPAKATVRRVMASVVDPNSIMTLTPSSISISRLQDNSLIPLSCALLDNGATDAFDAVWLVDGSIAALTRAGDILFIKDNNPIAVLTSRTINTYFNPFQSAMITAIAPASSDDAIVVGTADGKVLVMITLFPSAVVDENKGGNVKKAAKKEEEEEDNGEDDDEGEIGGRKLEVDDLDTVKPPKKDNLFLYMDKTVMGKCSSLPLRPLCAPKFEVVAFYQLPTPHQAPIVRILVDKSTMYVMTLQGQMWCVPSTHNVADAKRIHQEKLRSADRRARREKMFQERLGRRPAGVGSGGNQFTDGDDIVTRILQAARQHDHLRASLPLSCIASCNSDVVSLTELMIGHSSTTGFGGSSVQNTENNKDNNCDDTSNKVNNWRLALRGLLPTDESVLTFGLSEPPYASRQIGLGPGNQEQKRHNSPFHFHGRPIGMPVAPTRSISSARSLPLSVVAYEDGSIVILDRTSQMQQTRGVTILGWSGGADKTNGNDTRGDVLQSLSNTAPSAATHPSLLLHHHCGPGPCVATLHPSGLLLAVASARALMIFAITVHGLSLLMEIRQSRVGGVSISGDGTSDVLGIGGGGVQHQASVNTSCLPALAFSEDGSYLAYSDGCIVKALECYTLRHVATITAHTDAVTFLCFGRNAPGTLVSAGADGRVYVHRVADALRLGELVLGPELSKVGIGPSSGNGSGVNRSGDTCGVSCGIVGVVLRDKEWDEEENISTTRTSGVSSSRSSKHQYDNMISGVDDFMSTGEEEEDFYEEESNNIREEMYRRRRRQKVLREAQTVLALSTNSHSTHLVVLRNSESVTTVNVAIPGNAHITSLALAAGEITLHLVTNGTTNPAANSTTTFVATSVTKPSGNANTADQGCGGTGVTLKRIAVADLARRRRDDCVKMEATPKAMNEVSLNSNRQLAEALLLPGPSSGDELLIVGTSDGELLAFPFPLHQPLRNNGEALAPLMRQSIFTRGKAVTALDVADGLMVTAGCVTGEVLVGVLRIPHRPIESCISGFNKSKRDNNTIKAKDRDRMGGVIREEQGEQPTEGVVTRQSEGVRNNEAEDSEEKTGESRSNISLFPAFYMRPPVACPHSLLPVTQTATHNTILLSLVSRLCELQEQARCSLRRQALAKREKLRELANLCGDAIHEESRREDQMRGRLKDEEVKGRELVKKITESHTEEMLDVDTSYRNKLMAVEAQIQKARAEGGEKEAELRAEIVRVRKEHEQRMKVLEGNMKVELEIVRDKERRVNREKNELEINNKLSKEEDELERETLKALMLESQIQSSNNIRDNAMRQKGKLAIFRSRIAQLQLEAERLRGNIGGQDSVLANIEKEYHKLKADNKTLLSHIEERDILLLQKDNVIKLLKQRADAQHRLKDIKTFKIQELGKQVAPRQGIITDMKDQLATMENRTSSLVKQQEGTLGYISNSDTNIDLLKDKLKTSVQSLTHETRRIEGLMDSVIDIVKTQDKKEWMGALVAVARSINTSELFVDDFEERLRNKQEISRHNTFLTRELDAGREYAERLDGLTRAKIEDLILENSKMLDEESRTRHRIRAASYTIQERRASLGIARAEKRRGQEKDWRGKTIIENIEMIERNIGNTSNSINTTNVNKSVVNDDFGDKNKMTSEEILENLGKK